MIGEPWSSQEIKDTWINVADEDAAAKSGPVNRWERRHSHVSDRHMNLGHMKLLSDETPPDDMDGSWGLDDLDDDHPLEFTTSHNNPAANTANTASRLNEQNDGNITKNNDHRAHGYVNMSKDANTQLRSQSRGASNSNSDADHQSGASFLSTLVKKTPPASRKTFTAASNENSNAKYPWRDSKHDTIFTDLVDGHEQVRQLRNQDGFSVTTPRPQSMAGRGGVPHDDPASEADLSLSDIIDACNKGDDSIDPSRLPKLKKARRRLAQLSPSGDMQQDDNYQQEDEDLVSSVAESPAARTFQNNQEAFKQQRYMRVIKAGMNIDPNDNRDLAPEEEEEEEDLAGTVELAPTPGPLHIKTALGPTRQPSGIPTSSRSSRFSYGSRHRSQGSRDTEIGDRGSTTSRDSVYRDSLSGSTLGSAGFHAQLEGMNKHEMANVLTAFKSAAVAQLFAALDAEDDNSRILPRNVNSKSLTPTGKQQKQEQQQERQQEEEVMHALQQSAVLDAVSAPVAPLEDTDATPRPKERVMLSSSKAVDSLLRRFNPENDLNRARQYATLANRGLAKQTSSFVEELANATAMKSATDISFKSTPSPISKESKRQGAGTSSQATSNQTGSSSSNPAITEQIRREVVFKIVSPIDKAVRDVAENTDIEVEEMGSLIASRGMENAFKSLEELDMSFDVRSVAGREAGSSTRQSGVNRPATTDDERVGEHLSAVRLPSRSTNRGEYSLKWENQLDNVEGSSHRDANTSIAFSTTNDAWGAPEEASFSHTKDRLVSYITGLHPYNEWEHVKTLDLTKKEVVSTIHLESMLTNLEVLILNDNQVTHLSGISRTVKTLQARSNLLSDITNFCHLVNLQYLDISHNDIEDLTGVSSLVHLRELMAEGNKIKSVSALQQMDGLIRLDVSHNLLTSLDFRWSKLQRLEFLNASHNKIEQLENMESLTGLIHVNLANNCIDDISLVQPLRRIRILRLSDNKLSVFDAKPFPGLRTLYLDDNRLQTLENCQNLTRLENFSARDQDGEGIAIDMTEFINSRKLYLSGNPIHALDFEMGFYRLEYLEICAGCLSELPLDFSSMFPNLRGLNLSYNELDSISALDGLHRLRRLIFVGNKLKSFHEVLLLLKRMRSLVTLDLRHNPLTSNMYPAMSIRQGSKYQDTYRTNQNTETEQDWRRRDVNFRRSLPDNLYVKRSVYRSAVIKSCKRLEWFDGGAIQVRERERTPNVLGDMLENYGWNYLASNRRDDDEDDEYEYEAGYEYDRAVDGYQQQQQVQESEWLYSQEQLMQAGQQGHFQDGEEEDDEEFDQDDRDPEDITDNSKRPGSSVDSGSLNGQPQNHHHQGSMLARFPVNSNQQQQQQPRRLRPNSRYQVASPSLQGPVLTSSKALLNATRPGANRLSSSSTASQQQQQFIGSPSRRLSKRRSMGSVEQRVDGATTMEQKQRGTGGEDDAGEDPAMEGSADKRSAVHSWMDEVNKVAQRKQRSPRVPPTSVTDVANTGAVSRSQQVRRRDMGSVNGGSRSGGSRPESQNDGRNEAYSNEAPETSTIAVANNSGGQDPSVLGTPVRRRASSSVGPRHKFSIPPPPIFQQQQQQQQGQDQNTHRLSMHSRGRSDGTSAPTLGSGGSAEAAAAGKPTSLGRRSNSQFRSGTFGYETGSVGLMSPMQQPHHQLTMSGPNGMTASGTILRSAHQRRRSFALYPMGTAPTSGSRRKEQIGIDQQQLQRGSPKPHLAVSAPPPMMSMSASAHMLTQSPMALSPGYFGTTHQNMQSPFGFGKAAAGTGTPGGRSMPNTPSRGGGRASRVSLGGGPQTLARDMERDEIVD
ncbi:hypothetical protein BGZ99_009555 [Dissophora globulifera]|uniref:Septation initiation network scaffold protein cdc11 n=1 Tax=Dissophora globulifera TaxID=979702 RepID=A0A9P6RT91_9FUNG|nr:hypothetical protein BGZ99_009555 [Dissophora globulifera]